MAHPAGEAWLLCPAGPVDPRALTFTAHLAPDPECTVVVADLPDRADDGIIELLALAVPAGPDDLRLVFGRPRREAVPIARRLAERLGRTVITTAGHPLLTPGGGLFVGPQQGRGWVRCAPGAPEVWDSSVFPKPLWESVLPAAPRSLGRIVVETVPSGVWLRPAEENRAWQSHWTRLARTMAVSADLITVVIGVPGSDVLPVADVARFWQDLPPVLRPAVRFMCYGPARLNGGRHFGDVLAQGTGEPVRFLSGLPQGTSDGDDVLVVGADGAPGRPLRAGEFVHLPPGYPGPSSSPFAAVHRWPLAGLPQVRPGTHRLDDDVVVEVIRGGLWVRLAQEPEHAVQVRSTDPDPEYERVLCDAGRTEELPRLRRLARQLVRSFPPDLRHSVRLGVCRPTDPSGGGAPAAEAPRSSAASSPARIKEPGATAGRPPASGGLRPAPRPVPTAETRPPTGEHAGHTGLMSVAAEALRRHPGLSGPGPRTGTVAALAAVLRTLAGDDMSDARGGAGNDEGDGRPEQPDDALLREGLRILPVHRGPTGLRATLDASMRRWYAGQLVVTDPTACEASTLGPADAPGNTDFLIWSVNGRRTDLLDPLCPDRVLFLPGSRFRVLPPDPAAPEVVMMRELSSDGTPDDPALDDRAARELIRAWRNWSAHAST
ncbi:hypothetical protein ABZX74_45955 [Streptomyces olivaceoviridis]|uniref:hypothetical protein n=1 Tax=Streptomyces olivaceoviridis TaxID=1921 RepID=UPI0033BE4CD9